ncbi:carboxylesterase/lipase family protein [Actinomadura kijaniata]|uniref:carboxylesterase/lipase family protein n=1 Tax=Actinomadura kijaniata TaxID=46161 RepID=UPI00082BBFF1|nr:carboxylesterase family protein [Actinomadura kijaniata]
MEAAVVQTAYGKVRGKTDRGVAAYLGIPYAAPPFGADRFRPPRPPEPWDGVRDATEYGPTAPKPPYPRPMDRLIPDPDRPGEDCLNLNVWTPDPGASGLPVMVWIHGGAFRNGSGSVLVYDGANFARDGVVCVTINYRLGVEGFAHLPGAPDNRGLRDQIAALEWVRDNIAAFGGDPGNVTIFGESAGGMSVTTLLSLGLAEEGLFRRVIAQSGAGAVHQTPEDAMLVTREVAARLGVAPTAEAFAALDPATIIPAQAAVAAEVAALPDPGRWGVTTAACSMAMVPVLDDLFTRPAQQAIADGAGADADLLIGYTAEEFRLFLMPTGLAGLLTFDLVGPITAGMGVPAGVLETYRERHADLTAGELLALLVTDHMFRVPAHRAAAAHAGNTWMYEFAWRSPNHDLGACHALELGFTFDNLDSPDTTELAGPNPPQRLADAMHGAWVAFARDGDPGWERYDTATRPVQVFDGEKNPLVNDPRGEDRALWEVPV